MPIYKCELCSFITDSSFNYNKHTLTRKHQNRTNLGELAIQNRETIHSNKNDNDDQINQQYGADQPKGYSCKSCNYFTLNRYDYNKHINTKKHLSIITNTYNKNNTTCPTCKKEYSNYSSLWKHKKMCNKENLADLTNSLTTLPDALQENNATTTLALLELIKHSKEIQNFMMEQQKEIHNLHTTIAEMAKNQGSQTINNNTTNNHTTNNQFNLNFFLNEQCKNALNITDFFNSLQLNVNDLVETGKLGYVLGISRIFINKLKEMDIYTRPFHCTDYKRETVYIKDKDVWEKDSENREKLTLAIKKVASKNIKQIPVWQKANPDCFDPSSKKNDQYLKIVSNSMNGLTAEEAQKNYDKIITKVAKKVIINKEL